MKKAFCLILLILSLAGLCSCGQTYEGDAELIEKAREEIPLSDIQNTEISIAGFVDAKDTRLIWFMTGNEYETHGYFPLEFKAAEKAPNQFQFVHAYKAYRCGQDIAAYPWNGYVFLISNPRCEKLLLHYPDGREEEIAVHAEALPQLYFTSETPSQYTFVDEEGQEIF